MNRGFHGTVPSFLFEMIVSEGEEEFVFLLTHADRFLLRRFVIIPEKVQQSVDYKIQDHVVRRNISRPGVSCGCLGGYDDIAEYGGCYISKITFPH